MCLLCLEDLPWATWPPGLIKIELSCEQLRSNTACQEKLVRQSAVRPHGALRCEIKLRRSRFTTRKEDYECHKKGETLDGDEGKEIQRIAEVIFKERLIPIDGRALPKPDTRFQST
jgi:hypothetical protein